MRASKHSPLFFLAAFLLAWFSASVLRAQTNYVGSNSSGVSSNFTSGTNSYSATYIGFDVGADSNILSVENTDTVLTNSGVVRVGWSGSANRMVISNGGVVRNNTGAIGFNSASSNNSVLVTGTGSLWSNSSTLYVGVSGASSSLVISNGGIVQNAAVFIGYGSTSSNNSVLVTETGSFWSNSLGFYVGYSGASNSLVISNGGIVRNPAGIIGFASTSSNNSVLVTGANSRWTNTSALTVGSNGTANSLVISAGGSVRGLEVNLGGASTSSNNSVLVTGSNSSLFSTNSLRVGYRSSGNSLVVSNGAAVTTTGTASVGNAAANNNSLTVTGSGSTFAASTDLNVSWDNNTGNRLLVLDGATVTAQNLNLSAGEFDTSSSNNSVLISGSSGGVASTVTLSGNVYVGFGGRDNSLTISNGGRLLAANSFIGYGSSALRHNVLVTGAGSTWSNSGGLTLGRSGSGTLTVADGGSVAASGITIAESNGSAGTLNIGRFGTNDAAGTINGPLLRFGNSTNAPKINFNQSNSTTISAAISGNGTVNQLGSGTTTLTGSNSYTRGTTISAGTLQVGDGGTNGLLGSGAVTNNASLIVNRSDTLVLSNVISGTGRFTQAGAGTTTLSGASYSGGTLINAGALLGSTGGLQGNITNNGTVIFDQATNGSYAGLLSGSGAVNKAGAGEVTFTGDNSYTGSTSIQVGTLNLNAAAGAAKNTTSVTVSTDATLLLSQSDQVNNTATVTLSGGTITRGSGVSEVFGDLNLTVASFLDFGTGTAGNLTFGTYTPDSLLTINNFAGNTLVFGNDLSTTITNASYFSFSSGISSTWDGDASTFTITAIPEISTYVTALGLLALCASPLLRRKRTGQ